MCFHTPSIGWTYLVLCRKENTFIFDTSEKFEIDEKIIKREFGNLESIDDNYEKIVISLDDISFGNKNGIKHICAWELKFDS